MSQRYCASDMWRMEPQEDQRYPQIRGKSLENDGFPRDFMGFTLVIFVALEHGPVDLPIKDSDFP